MSKRLTLSEFTARVEKIHKGKIKVIGKYKNNRTKILLHCRSCGNDWGSRPYHTMSGVGCPNCKPISKGEDAVAEYLDNVGLTYVREYTFEDLILEKPLRYDFAVINTKTLQVAFLIEFDGVQHFKPVERFGGVRALKQTQIRDRLKTEYAEKSEIPLLRIRYDQLHRIDEILAEGQNIL